MKNTGEGNDRKEERLNPSTAPHAEDVEHADRMEGSYAPGLPEYGPGRAQAPDADPDRAEGAKETDIDAARD